MGTSHVALEVKGGGCSWAAVHQLLSSAADHYVGHDVLLLIILVCSNYYRRQYYFTTERDLGRKQTEFSGREVGSREEGEV